MQLFVDILCVSVLFIVIFQDFKNRSIAGIIIPALLVLFFFKSYFESNFTTILHYFLINNAFILLQILLVTVYFSLRFKKMLNVINNYLGSGDVLFLMSMTTLFTPLNFIFFYIIAIFITTLSYGTYLVASGRRDYPIPLAGSMAIVLIVFFVLQYFFDGLKFSNETLVENTIKKWMT